MKVFFTYVDWTLEVPPRAFYVGKGTLRRVNERERNAHWKHIAAKHGWRRECLFATKEEAFAFEQEILGILEFGTFDKSSQYHWGANKTAGGEGSTGWKASDEQRENVRLRVSGEGNPMFGKKHRPDSLRLNSESNKISTKGERNGFYNKHHTDETRKLLRQKTLALGDNNPMKRSEIRAARCGENNPLWSSEKAKKKHAKSMASQEVRQKISEKRTGQKASEETKARMRATRGGAGNGNAKLTADQVLEIRRMRTQTGLSYLKLAKLFSVSEACIADIIKLKAWT